jgi:anti-sigma B factor antagonist
MGCNAIVREAGGVSVVELSGRIALGDGSGVVRETVRDLLNREKKHILLDLGGVSYIDSTGLGELVGSYATVTQRGGQIKLVNAQKRVHDLLLMTKLYTVFEAFTDEPAALASFA